jgi:hypothetical protein
VVDTSKVRIETQRSTLRAVHAEVGLYNKLNSVDGAWFQPLDL